MSTPAFLVLVSGLLGLTLPGLGQPARTIHVVIIGVTKFEIADYNNPVLTDAISERCTALRSYFESHLGAPNVTVHSFCKPELTKREALRRIFAVEIPSFSAHTVTIVFLMSHGEAVSFNNDFLKSDVELIASDTTTSDVQNDSKGERLFSSVLLGSDVMSWLQRAPAGSTILMFVDTCHSGAAASLSSQVTAFLQQQFGLVELVMASALPSDSTYQALFTQALMDLWDSGTTCLNEDTLPSDIFKKVSAQVPLSGSEGLPTFIVKYSGPVCLGNFGKDRKLLFIYAGQDAQARPYKYQVSEVLPSGPHPIASSLVSYAFLPIPLDAKKYIVSVQRFPDVSKTINVDFESSGPVVIWLDSQPPPQDVGRFAEAMAVTAARNGSSDEEVYTLQQQAVDVYDAIGLTDEARRVEKGMHKTQFAVRISQAVEPLAFKPQGEVNTIVHSLEFLEGHPIITGLPPVLSTSGFALVSLARDLELVGDFRNAAFVYKHAADAASDALAREQYAGKAYTDLNALGEFDAAKDVQEKFSISSDTTAPFQLAVQNDPSGQGKLTYKALNIIQAVSKVHVVHD